MAVTSVHEHMHDIVRKHYGRLNRAPPWVHEGICQYISAIFCKKYKLKKSLIELETHGDPVYGNSYRFFRKKFGANNWPGLRRWMKSISVRSIPRNAPIVRD